MFRNVLFGFAFAGLMCSGQAAFSLGLGGLKHTSYLHQRFDGTIPLADSEGVPLDEIRVGQAEAEAFEKAGVQRQDELLKLKFSVVEADNERVVVVNSDDPITEPAIRFMLEARWPGGRILKTFTVLLAPGSMSL